MYGPVSLDMSVVVSLTTGPRDSPHRRSSESGTGHLERVSRGPVPDPETLRISKMGLIFDSLLLVLMGYAF